MSVRGAGAILLAAVGAGLVACGGSSPGVQPRPGSPVAVQVSGMVRSWPCGPVEQAGSPCAGRPAPGVEVRFEGPAGAVTVKTGGDGHYAVELAPGDYTVSVIAGIGGRPVRRVSIVPGPPQVLDLTYDSGIR